MSPPINSPCYETNEMAKDLESRSSNGLKSSKDSIATISGGQTTSKVSRGNESFLSKAQRLITVEPVFVCYMISFQANLPIQQQFAYRKLLEAYANQSAHDGILMNNGSDGAMHCGNGTTGREVQAKAQASSALLSILVAIATIIPAIFSTVLLGSFSDRAGRKWGMIPPFIGDILKSTIMIFTIVFDLPFWQLLIVASLINSSCGNTMLVLSSVISYIADITTLQQRMFRIIIIEILTGFADLAANLIAGYLIAAIGFLYSYVFLLCLNFLNLGYTIFILKETVQRMPGARLCSLDNYKKAINVYTRNDVPGRRGILFVCLLIFIFQTMVEQGANATSLDLYFLNIPLCWKSVQIGYFRAFLVIVRFSFNMVAVRLLLPKLTSGGLLLLGCGSLIIYDLLLAQVVANWMAYLAVVTSFAAGMIAPMLRGITSQNVEPQEQGAVFSGQGIVILVSTLCGITMYSSLYSHTVRTFSRTIFYIAATQGAIAMAFSSILFWTLRKHQVATEPNVTVLEVNAAEKDKRKGRQVSNTPAEATRF